MTKERELIHQQLIQLDNQNKLTPQAVVELARDPKNPLHGEFEWDNKVAGEKYRLQQARTLISDFEVTVEVNETEYRLNEFVERPLKSDKQQGYVSIHKLVNDKRLAAECVNRQLTIARTYAEKGREFAQYLGLEERVSKTVASIDEILAEVRSRLQQQQAAVS